MTANVSYSTQNILGVNLNQTRTTIDGPAVRVGTVVHVISDNPGGLGGFAMYVQANTAMTQSSFVTVDLTTISCLASTTASATSSGFFQAMGSIAINASEYFWALCVKTAIPQGRIPPNNPNP